MKFSHESVVILVVGTDENVAFNVNGTGTYEIINLNQDIATVTLESNCRLVIRTENIGNAMIRAINTNDRNVYCDIKVGSITLNGVFLEKEYFSELEIADEETKDLIVADIVEYIGLRAFIYLEFN